MVMVCVSLKPDGASPDLPETGPSVETMVDKGGWGNGSTRLRGRPRDAKLQELGERLSRQRKLLR